MAQVDLSWAVGSGRTGPAAALVRAGEKLEKRGDVAGAEDAYRRADAAGNAEGASDLGVLLFERDDIEAAHAALVRADQRGSGMGAFRLGFLLEETGKPTEAEQAYRRAVERGNEHAASNLTDLLRRRGDHAGAAAIEQPTAHAAGQTEAILAEAERRGIPTLRVDDAEDLLIGMAKTELEQGRTARAEQILREVLDRGRQARGLAALNLGILLQERGDLAGARQAYETALASEDHLAAGAAALNLGHLLATDGEAAEDERLFATAMSSGHPEAAPKAASAACRASDLYQRARQWAPTNSGAGSAPPWNSSLVAMSVSATTPRGLPAMSMTGSASRSWTSSMPASSLNGVSSTAVITWRVITSATVGSRI
jgi:tetratricopeptide (TPR) repeat protein